MPALTEDATLIRRLEETARKFAAEQNAGDFQSNEDASIAFKTVESALRKVQFPIPYRM